MPKRIDVHLVPSNTGSAYPQPFDAPCANRARQRLGHAAELTDFGVNLLHLPSGAWSSQRHWHVAEDEFVCTDGEREAADRRVAEHDEKTTRAISGGGRSGAGHRFG